MSRWIDADALITDLNKGLWGKDWDKVLAEAIINEAPSIDIVPCKECRRGKPYSDKQLECDALGLGGLKFPDDFCSYGERREP